LRCHRGVLLVLVWGDTSLEGVGEICAKTALPFALFARALQPFRKCPCAS